MRRTTRRTTAVAAALLAAAVVVPATASADAPGYDGDETSHSADRDQGDGLRAIGLSDDGTSLVSFSTDQPGEAESIGDVEGLEDDVLLVGIDFRVQNGALYGVGDQGGLYTIDAYDAQATKVGQLSVALEGERFGVDFNPAANALRVVSDTGQNLRQPFADAEDPDAPNGDTVVDGPLTNPATPPATGTVPAVGVTGAAYTNNDLDDGTSTTLFDVDTDLDRTAIQSPANAGSLAPTGSLRVDAGADAGFDIYSTLSDERTVENQAFATLSVDGEEGLYSINLTTGEAADLGGFEQPVTDLAIELDQS